MASRILRASNDRSAAWRSGWVPISRMPVRAQRPGRDRRRPPRPRTAVRRAAAPSRPCCWTTRPRPSWRFSSRSVTSDRLGPTTRRPAGGRCCCRCRWRRTIVTSAAGPACRPPGSARTSPGCARCSPPAGRARRFGSARAIRPGTRMSRTGRRCERRTVNSSSAWVMGQRRSCSACWMSRGVRMSGA